MQSSDSKHVAIFLPSLIGGGAERIMVNLATGLVEQGVKVDLVLANAEGPYLADVDSRVRIINLRARRVLTSLPGLVSYLRREKPISILSSMEHVNIIAIWATRLAMVKTRIVVTVHIALSQSLNKSSFRGRFFCALIRLFYPLADNVVVVSKAARDDFLQTTGLDPKLVSVIYNPVITSELYKKKNETIDHPWFSTGEPPVILGVGRLSKQKDFPNLIHAFALVRKRQNARLVIIGEGNERPNLEKLIDELGIKSDVDLHGFVENSYAYMARSAVFVLSSAYEGLPTVLIESLAVGIPVVSTDCPSGPMEILNGGKYGKLVPMNDSNALAKGILEVLQQEVVSEVAADAIEEFTLEKSVARYMDILLCKANNKSKILSSM